MGKLLQSYKQLECDHFQTTFETHKQSLISAFLIYITVPLIKRIRKQGESKIPLCNPSGGKLPLRTSVSYNKLLGGGVFRTPQNIYDEAFFAKIVNGFKTLTVFLQKTYVADVRLVSKYASSWESALNVGCRQIVSAWNLQLQARTQESTRGSLLGCVSRGR